MLSWHALATLPFYNYDYTDYYYFHYCIWGKNFPMSRISSENYCQPCLNVCWAWNIIQLRLVHPSMHENRIDVGCILFMLFFIIVVNNVMHSIIRCNLCGQLGTHSVAVLTEFQWHCMPLQQCFQQWLNSAVTAFRHLCLAFHHLNLSFHHLVMTFRHHFGKIIKIVATRGQVLRLKCT